MTIPKIGIFWYIKRKELILSYLCIKFYIWTPIVLKFCTTLNSDPQLGQTFVKDKMLRNAEFENKI